MFGKEDRAQTDTVFLQLGSGFLSHSWSDENEVPGAKYKVVKRWAKARTEAAGGQEPTLWLVRFEIFTRAPDHKHGPSSLAQAPWLPSLLIAPHPCAHAQDKACIVRRAAA